jgi:hypothetical protein
MTSTTVSVSEATKLQITTAQHIFPRSCLRRFAGRGGRLQVRVFRTGRVEHHGPYSDRFTTARAWDQRTEAKVMQRIEAEFGRVVAPIRKGQVDSLLPEQHQVVTQLYALWMLRAHRARAPIPDIQLHRVWMAGAERSDAAIDELESHGIITVRPGGVVLGRQMAGPQLQLDLDRACTELNDVQWGVLRAAPGAGEFCIPDAPERILYLPLTPVIALAGAWPDGEVGREVILAFNTAAVEHSREFVAARDLSSCPCSRVVDRAAP